MSFLPRNFMEEISPNPEILSANTWRLSSALNSWKDKNNDLDINALIYSPIG